MQTKKGNKMVNANIGHNFEAAINDLKNKQGARDKNNGNHRAGITKNYPNRFFELANEIKMLAKLKYKVGDEIAEDIPKALELVKQKKA